MDFSLVKRLFIPQGEVTKITNLEGITLWQKISRVLKEWRGLSPLTCTPTVAGEFEDVKLYGQSKQGVLPDGYTQLEYLETTGSQYIDTGIKPSVAYTWFKGKIVSTATNLGLGCRDAGGGTSNGANSFFNYSNQVGNTRLDWVDNTTAPARVLGDSTGVYDIKYLGSGKYDINGHSETIVPAVPAQTSRKSYSFYIGATNQEGTLRFVVPQKIHPCSLYYNDGSGDILEFDGIPARRNSDGVLGMYDLVTGQLFPNAGTGTFIAGGTAPTPTAPIEIESVGDKTVNVIDNNNKGLNALVINSTTGGTVSWGSAWTYIDYTEIKPNAEYTFYNKNLADLKLADDRGYAFYDENKNFISGGYRTNTNIVNFTTPNNAKYFRVSVMTTDTYMLVEGTYTASNTPSYEPYGKYKVPVMVGGKNLFNFTTFRTQTVGGVTYTNNNDGSISCYGNANSGNAITIATLKAGTYTFNLNQTKISNQVDVMFSFVGIGDMYDTDKLYNSFTYIFTSDTTINIKRSTNGFIDKDIKIQIEEGSQATSYQPYIQPTTTNIYLSEPLRKIGEYADTMSIVKSKNLFDKNDTSSYIAGYLESNGTIATNNGYTMLLECKPNTTYTFSRKESSNRYRVGSTPRLKENIKVNTSGITLISSKRVDETVLIDTFTTTSDAKTLVIWFTNTSDLSVLQSQLNQIQIEEGSTATPYEPYGTVAMVTRNIEEVVYNGSEQWSYYSTSEGSLFRNTITNAISPRYGNTLCDKYKVVEKIIGSRPNYSLSGDSMSFDIINNNFSTSIDFKNYLQTNNVTLDYVLATPTTETYTIENPILALDNTSIITVDTTTPPSEVYASEYVEE